MSRKTFSVELVKKAQAADSQALSALAAEVEPRLRAFILRSTLNPDLTGDIVQETLMQMLRSIQNLRKAEHFSAWIYRIAANKLAHHYNIKKKRSELTVSDIESFSSCDTGADGKSPESRTFGKELKNEVFSAVATLEHRQRSVVSLRCFEDMSYRQIAEVLGCSEVSARVDFFRAKKNLKSSLAARGIKSAMLVTALTIFGKMTSPTKAAAQTLTVNSASVGSVGITASVIGTAAGGVGIAAISLVLCVAAVMTAINLKSDDPKAGNFFLPARNEIRSFHYVRQAWDSARIPNANLLMGKSLSKGAYEQWFFFPDGIDGPMFTMVQRWNPQMKNKLCGWLQDGSGNYYYHSGQNTIYRYDCTWPKIKTPRLPADTPEFVAFLDKIEGADKGVECTRDEKTGLLTGILDARFANSANFKSDISYNKYNEKSFGAFRYQWPDDCPVIDQRNEMHKQGWTLFEITGHIDGQKVRGFCQTPFIYAHIAEHPPLLKLAIGDEFTIYDSPAGASVVDSSGEVIRSYAGGAFFKGLLRPWFGMHSLDTIRRDAAKSFVPFKVQNLSSENTTLTLYNVDGYKALQIVYSLNVDKNQIRNMQFDHIADGHVTNIGQLNFAYPKKPEDINTAVDIAEFQTSAAAKQQHSGILWLFELIEGSLVE
ncbi:MAG: sigma-70 family RNA polymerase sigma factor [Anaerohalosphaeraceae bacterium]|nr:sigma-70 family RNA polymerase sigma factor [Anaerohalosphaeraceae bacterium]